MTERPAPVNDPRPLNTTVGRLLSVRRRFATGCPIVVRFAVRDPDCGSSSETRREYIHVGSEPASLRATVSEELPQSGSL